MSRTILAVKLLVAAILVAGLLPAIASAAVLPMDVAELAERADSIVTVKVTGSGARKGNPMRGGIEWAAVVTDTRLHVAKVIKGARPTEFTLSQPGGTLGGTQLVVTDLPEFVADERCILFLNSDGGVVGGHQGKLTIVGGQVPALGMKLSDAQKLLRELGDNAAAKLRSQARRYDPDSTFEFQASVAGEEIAFSTIARTEVAEPSDVPAVAAVTPHGAAANVSGIAVEITGSGFGSSRGAGRVDFRDGRYLSSQPLPAVAIKEWSDTRIVCEVPRYAQSGSVVVTDGQGRASVGFRYKVGFGRSGLKTDGTTFKYRINSNCGDLTYESVAIRAAFATWNAAGSKFKLGYAGTCSSRANRPIGDGHSDIYWASSGFSDSGILGWNCYWKMSDGRTIIESDIVLNDRYTWSNAPSKGQFDVESVVLHELGHTAGLDDQYAEFDKVMGAAMSGSSRRSLSWAEVDGVRHIYGSTVAAGESRPDPIPTSLTLVAPSVSNYRSARLSGRVRDSAGKALYNKPVRLEYSYDKKKWRIIGLVYTNKIGKDGRPYYAHYAKPTKRIYYRARFMGDSSYAGKTSTTKQVLPRVYFSSAPRFSTYTHTYGKTYKVWGYLKPKHASGSTEFKVLAYRKEKQSDGSYKYVYRKSYSTKISNPSGSSYSKYTGYVKLPSKGKWRLRVRHIADSSNAKSYTSYRYVTAK